MRFACLPPGAVDGQERTVLAKFLKDIAKLNEGNLRIFGPDDTLSNLLSAVVEVPSRHFAVEVSARKQFFQIFQLAHGRRLPSRSQHSR
jgi:xylulose-5-phosphate/fructose-6-phosphate phosphoketolase